MRDVAIPEPEQRARSYPHQLSGGMRQRVMIAMAIVNRPQLLIADEPTTALDVTIQQQILDLLNDLRHKFGLAMLFISHDLAVVSHVADRVAVMYAGNLVELGAKADIFRAPAHPYTQGLLRAIPTLATDRALPLATIEGTVPSIAALPPGCPFEPRCPYRVADLCRRAPSAGRSRARTLGPLPCREHKAVGEHGLGTPLVRSFENQDFRGDSRQVVGRIKQPSLLLISTRT